MGGHDVWQDPCQEVNPVQQGQGVVESLDALQCQLNAKIMRVLEGTHSLIKGRGALMFLVDLCRVVGKGVRVRDSK